MRSGSDIVKEGVSAFLVPTMTLFVQQTRPTQTGPWLWFETDAGGTITDMTVNTDYGAAAQLPAFVQAGRPDANGPWVWFQTDPFTGILTDIIVNDGA